MTKHEYYFYRVSSTWIFSCIFTPNVLNLSNRSRCWNFVCWALKFYFLLSSASGSLKKNTPSRHDRAVDAI